MKTSKYKSLFYFLVIVIFFQMLSASISRSSELSPSEIASRLQKSYDSANTISADFKQITTMSLTRRQRTGAGTMLFMRPGRMRWDYLVPDKQILISDGSTFYMYLEKSNQMIISSAKEYLQSDVTYSFFSGTGDILRDFDVQFTENGKESEEMAYGIKLTPKKPHPQVTTLYMWVDHESFMINHLQIIDHFDTITDLFFSDIKVNKSFSEAHKKKIDDKLFTITPPPETEIIRQ